MADLTVLLQEREDVPGEGDWRRLSGGEQSLLNAEHHQGDSTETRGQTQGPRVSHNRTPFRAGSSQEWRGELQVTQGFRERGYGNATEELLSRREER
jgi:hypothetical protein